MPATPGTDTRQRVLLDDCFIFVMRLQIFIVGFVSIAVTVCHPNLRDEQFIRCDTDTRPTPAYQEYMARRKAMKSEQGQSPALFSRQTLNVDLFFHVIAASTEHDDGWLSVRTAQL
jgi:hypothetical protein